MSDINYDFKDLLNVGENFNLLYTQMLNGKRIRSEKTGVVYVFDEVGCGKTVSAIIAIASVIKEKQMENEGYKILVLTQKSVCLQFEEEIKEKLKIDSNVIYNVAYDTTNSLEENIPAYRKKSCIIVSNPHKIGYLNGKEKRCKKNVYDRSACRVARGEPHRYLLLYRLWRRAWRQPHFPVALCTCHPVRVALCGKTRGGGIEPSESGDRHLRLRRPHLSHARAGI